MRPASGPSDGSVASMLEVRIHPLGETDLDTIVIHAGGTRAHPDADSRQDVGVDYLLGDTLIELKALDDDGLAKSERQQKLAALFAAYDSERSVIVLDRARLPEDEHRVFDRIMEGPIKSAVSKARKQIKQSRSEITACSSSVLLIVNNGYSALDHEELKRIVFHRVRNDTREIGGIVVAGCYYYSDGFDSFFLWPMDYLPVHNNDRVFQGFEKLRSAWNDFANSFMTTLVRELPQGNPTKGPILDSSFEVGGITFVRPAPPMGAPSEFYRNGRPRQNEYAQHPAVAITIPALGLNEWTYFRQAFPQDYGFHASHLEWQQEAERAFTQSTPMQPLVPITVAFESWQSWPKAAQYASPSESLRQYANFLFEERVRALFQAARERTADTNVPERYVLVETEVIGQNAHYDISHIAAAWKRPFQPTAIRPIAKNIRAPLHHAIALAAAYAINEDIPAVLWQKDLRYAWV